MATSWQTAQSLIDVACRDQVLKSASSSPDDGWPSGTLYGQFISAPRPVAMPTFSESPFDGRLDLSNSLHGALTPAAVWSVMSSTRA